MAGFYKFTSLAFTLLILVSSFVNNVMGEDEVPDTESDWFETTLSTILGDRNNTKDMFFDLSPGNKFT